MKQIFYGFLLYNFCGVYACAYELTSHIKLSYWHLNKKTLNNLEIDTKVNADEI